MISYETFFILILVSILGPIVSFSIFIFHIWHEREIYLLEMENHQIILEKELEISRYLQLNHQIEPHFLFNALNSLLGLIRLKQYDRLSESFENMVLYLRSNYKNKDPLYPLSDEISYTKNYLEIQKLRFGQRLKVEWLIGEGLTDAFIIPYLLQTLVENSFKHGLEMIEEKASLLIRIQLIGGNIVNLQVEDNGPGFKEDPFRDESNNRIGLRNIQRRLSLLFGNEAMLKTQNRNEGGGAIVEAMWPLQINTVDVKEEKWI